LNDYAIGTPVAVADPSSTSFPTQQPGHVLSFATGYSSTQQKGLRRQLTKFLSTDTIVNHQERLATPTPKKKKKKKMKATHLLPLFYEATYSPVSTVYKSENKSTNVSSTVLPDRGPIDRSAWRMYPDPWNE
jgi:hypothetical protein